MRSLLTLTLLVLTFSGCASSVDAFSNFDQNGDAAVTEDEFATELYNSWDANDDDQMSPGEFDAGAASINGFPTDANFGDWDEDDNELLSETEFADGFSQAQIFDDWDLDDSETLEAEEFNKIGMR